jgi:hypothetical protein
MEERYVTSLSASSSFPLAVPCGQIIMRKVDGWETLDLRVADHPLDQAA